MITVHFIDVGQGNMTLIDAGTGGVVIYDCNITDDNQTAVLGYTRGVLNGRRVAAFMNSHRDADHMRGVARLHEHFGINEFWDCGVPGSTIDSTEYTQYMRVRGNVGCWAFRPGTAYTLGPATVMVVGAASPGPFDANTQSAVVKVSYLGNAVMLTGDTDVRSWKAIRSSFSDAQLKSTFLLAGHHGSDTFFEDAVATPAFEPSYASLFGSSGNSKDSWADLFAGMSPYSQSTSVTSRRQPNTLAALAALVASGPDVRRREPSTSLASFNPSFGKTKTLGEMIAAALAVKKKWYTDHVTAIAPAVTIVSVGSNSHGHPHADAMRLYEQHSTGRSDGRKVLRTDQHGTIVCRLNADGTSTIGGLREAAQ